MTEVLKKPSGYRFLEGKESKEKLMRTIYPLASQQLVHPSATLHTSSNVTPRGKKLIDNTRLSFIKVSDPKRESNYDLKTEGNSPEPRI